MRKLKYTVSFTAQSANIDALYQLFDDVQIGEVPKNQHIIPIVVFMAFSIESYVNSLGSQKIPYWDVIERLRWREKIDILHKASNTTADWGAQPLAFAIQVFSVRDKLAHGKAEDVSIIITEDNHEYYLDNPPKPKWLKGITKEWVNDSYERFQTLMTYLASVTGLPESGHNIHSVGRVEIL